jgi:phage baseplate assembly protein W|tara:strand:- start:2857 stop:3264 length:408 start_codon:yes stop_codon:yes gene_type:complete
MAFGAVQQFPNDTRPRVGIGVNIPFNEGGVFTPNYTTADSIKNNLINYFLTNPGERPGNPTFGGGLRAFIFSSISDDNLDFLQEDVSQKIASQFPNVSVKNLEVLANTDNNEVVVQIYYTVINTSIEGELVLNFT